MGGALASWEFMQTVKVAMFSVDPPGLSAFHTFDPESFTLISVIHDALIYIDNEGAVQPALATSWRRVSPLEIELSLRRGVRFHNGEPFDADSVVATFRAHQQPTPSAAARGALGVIAGATRIDDFTVRLTTTFPDAMLVRRLFLSSIYPRGVLAQHGRDYFASHPIGTGPYRFVCYEPGREIVLERNREHWLGKATVDRLRLMIVRQKEWVTRLERGELDVAFGIDSHDRVRAGRIPGLRAASRQAAITQWFLLANRGPLADVRVRQAMNHALDRRLLTDVTEHGYGTPQRSIATVGQQGYTVCEPYRYSPERSRALLAEAGIDQVLHLRGLVSETSTAVYFAAKEFLGRVGIELEAEIVPRAEWINRVVGGNMRGQPYGGDFAIAVVDNPILHTLFHHFIFLFSKGPFSLLRDPAYDAEFLRTAATFGDAEADQAQAALERYVRDNALVVFTVHEDAHAAWRDGLSCELPRSGHFQVDALMSLRVLREIAPARPLAIHGGAASDASILLDATSHAGAFFLRPGIRFEQPVMQQIWDNLRTSEQRWSLQSEPMMRELVSQVEAKACLADVLGSTERVAIVGYTAEGRQLFVNAGYRVMFGDGARPVFDHLGAGWAAMRAQLDRTGSWLGPVQLTAAGRPPAAPDRLYLSITRALDHDGVARGYVFVFSDFSGEEERIRHQAIRTIVDNVPYGLFMCDAAGRVMGGYSESCARFFADAAAGIEGRLVIDLLAMDSRTVNHFLTGYEQVFDDHMPEEVSLANLPPRVAVGPRSFALYGSVVRDDRRVVSAVLFTLLDITNLIEAEREISALRGALCVARYRDRFEDFARQLHARLRELASAPPDDSHQHRVRIELHTAKGVFAQFSLQDLAEHIHQLEDKPAIDAADLRVLDRELCALIDRNARLWGIRLDNREDHYTTTETVLAALEARLAATASLDEIRRVLAHGFDDIRRKPVRELLGPVEESCAQQAERSGKRVRLALEGSDTRWPARLAEAFDVLPHLIRNSIDHGIEAPGDRHGKPEIATIRLGVAAGNGLHISLCDDGRGIDTERVARRALELGAITEHELANMPPSDRLKLIFVGGLSTADQVSETSGRGVGMAAVQRAVEALGGTLSVSSDLGRGTEFRIDFASADD